MTTKSKTSAANDGDTNNKKAKTHVSPKGLLMEYINELVVEAGESGVGKI